MTPERVCKPSAVLAPTGVQAKVTHARDWPDERGTHCNIDGMARYGIVAPKVYGVSVATMVGSPNRSVGVTTWRASSGIPDGTRPDSRRVRRRAGEADASADERIGAGARRLDDWRFDVSSPFDETLHVGDDRQVGGGRAEKAVVKRAAFAVIASVALHDQKTRRCPTLARP
jgi:hypothetical protein